MGMTEDGFGCVILRHLRHPMTHACVTDDALPKCCVTTKPQVSTPARRR